MVREEAFAGVDSAARGCLRWGRQSVLGVGVRLGAGGWRMCGQHLRFLMYSINALSGYRLGQMVHAKTCLRECL